MRPATKKPVFKTSPRLRSGLRTFTLSLALAVPATQATGDENWVNVGEVKLATTRATGKLDIRLDSLRRRGQHYEVWERLVFAVDAAHRGIELASDRQPEQRRLWAIACRSGSLAKVSEGEPGAFEPRPEKLAFYVPAPTSAQAAIIDLTCAEVRRRVAEQRAAADATATPDEADSPGGQRKTLALPPSLFANDGFDEDDE